MSESPTRIALQHARALLRANQIDAGMEALQVLANQNIPEAMFELASIRLMFATDAGTIREAMHLLHRAEQAGSAPASYRLATASLVEAAEALDWQTLAGRWLYACQQKLPSAVCDAAVYFGRFGTPRQQLQSTAMLESAALNGSVVAMALLGERLSQGRLCSPNPARANSIRKLAAELGMPVPAPDSAYGFAAAEPPTRPNTNIDWEFGDIAQATQAGALECLDADTALHQQGDLLSAEECLYIQCLGGPDLAPSLSVDDHGRRHRNTIRSSWDFIFLPECEQLYLNLLQRRMAAAAELPLAQAEALILLRYLPGQEYRPHRDTLPPSHYVSIEKGGSGQRLRTTISYLNSPKQGGETAFPLLNQQILAEQGKLVRFDNMQPDGDIIATSLHSGLPVRQGVKWICTLWFHQRAHRLL